MQAASPEVARARGPLNSLHPLVSSGGANNSVAFAAISSCCELAHGMGLKLCTETHVERAQFASFGLDMSCARGDSYKRLLTVWLVEAPTRDGGV